MEAFPNNKILPIFSNLTLRIRHDVKWNDRRHGHSAGFTPSTAIEIFEQLSHTISDIKGRLNLYIQNPLTAEILDYWKQQLASVIDDKHISAVNIGGFGGYNDEMPFEALRDFVAWANTHEKSVCFEFGTAVVERSMTLVFPPSYNNGDLLANLPDAHGDIGNIVHQKTDKGIIVMRPVSYAWYIRLLKQRQEPFHIAIIEQD